mmetsp:Transcript_108016/g.315833  ORF Transcript_108016/g.315833 Transcript_108016/m.315833 type:complete len:220 (+) Transcript_108016:522-1181(+)
MLTMSSCQWPSFESRAVHQESSAPSCMRSRRKPPKVISLSSLSDTARKTAKSFLAQSSPPFQDPAAAEDSTKLNSGVWERLERPRPKTPSNAKLAKGSSVMSMAETSLRFTQPRCRSGRAAGAGPPPWALALGVAGPSSLRLAFAPRTLCTSLWSSEEATTGCARSAGAGGPRQRWSRTKMPVTSPVPKETVIWSRACQGLTTVPSTSMSSARSDARRR